MEGKENVFQELPREMKQSSLMNKECVFYPPPERVKGNNTQKIKEQRSRQDKYPTLMDRKNMESPKYGLKRSKPLDPSQRPFGIVKKSKPETFINTPVHQKRFRIDQEPDSVEGKCIMKPKRLKFSEECNTSLDSVDANQDYTGLSTTYDEDADLFPNDESEKEYEEQNVYNPIGPETPSSAINNLFEIGLDSGYETKCQSDVSVIRSMKGPNIPFLSNLNSDCSESIIEATEIDISNQTSQTEAQNEKLPSDKTSRKIGEAILPPIPKKQRRLPKFDQCAATSMTKDDRTSDINDTEAANAQNQDKDIGIDEPYDCFSSPIISGPRKRLFSMHSQSTPNTSIGSPCNSIISSNSRKSVSSHISRSKNIQVFSSPISSGGDCKLSRTDSSITRKKKDNPPATSTPRRLSCARLQAFSHETMGPGGDVGLTVASQSSQDDLYSQDPMSEGPYSYNGSDTGFEPNMVSQKLSLSKMRSVTHMSEGDNERSTVFYPESSSEPDRYNTSGDVHCFQGIEPIYQFSSMYQGRDLTNQINVTGGQNRYTLLGQNHGTPTARRHLNFEPTAQIHDEDHTVARSIMDPEE